MNYSDLVSSLEEASVVSSLEAATSSTSSSVFSISSRFQASGSSSSVGSAGVYFAKIFLKKKEFANATSAKPAIIQIRMPYHKV